MKSKKAVLSMIVVALVWAPSFSATANIISEWLSITIVGIRFLSAFLLFYFTRILTGNREKIKKEDYALLGFVSFCCILHYISSNVSSVHLNPTELIVFSSFQCMITLIGVNFIQDKIVKPKLAVYVGISAVGSVFTMVIRPLNTTTILSYLLMSVAMIAWSLYCIYLPNLLVKYKLITVLYYQFLICSICLLPAIINKGSFTLFSEEKIFPLMYLSIFCTFLAFILNAYALKYIEVIDVSIIMNINPVIVFFINLVQVKIETNFLQIFGVILIVVGIVLVVRDNLKNKKIEQVKHE